MQTLEHSSAFKRDIKRISATPRHHKALDILFSSIPVSLLNDQPLPKNNRDHALTGNWDSYRECHIKPDLLLIYRKPDAEILQLVRLGSHSELFG